MSQPLENADAENNRPMGDSGMTDLLVATTMQDLQNRIWRLEGEVRTLRQEVTELQRKKA